MSSNWIVVGKIKRARGLTGEMEVIPYTDFPQRFKPGLKLFLSPPHSYHRLTVDKADFRGKRLHLRFTEISTLEQAETLQGCLLSVTSEERAGLPENTFWVDEVIGMDVYLISGILVGKIKEIIRTGSNDVYVIEPTTDKTKRRHEILIPAIKDVVKKIDLEKKQMIIEPLPGLLPEEK